MYSIAGARALKGPTISLIGLYGCTAGSVLIAQWYYKKCMPFRKITTTIIISMTILMRENIVHLRDG